MNMTTFKYLCALAFHLSYVHVLRTLSIYASPSTLHSTGPQYRTPVPDPSTLRHRLIVDPMPQAYPAQFPVEVP